MRINEYEIKPGANLRDADLRGANLRDADLQGADSRGANLQGANLQGANLWGANLQGANLQGANLQGANLRGSNLRGSNLRFADLRGANLRFADLRGANLQGTEFQGSDLLYAELPSPTMILLAEWGKVSDELTRELMRYDAPCHEHPESFKKWARGGECPFQNTRYERAANFKEKRNLYVPGFPLRPFDLMVRCLREVCADSDYHDREVAK